MATNKDGAEKLWRAFELLFLERRWDKIRDSWIAFVPLIEAGGKPPPEELLLANALEALFPSGAPQKGAVSSLEGFPRAELPEIVLREAIYWLHKATHVLGASEKHIEDGLPTWSLSAGYQAAFFAARAVLAFHGIAVGEHDGASFVIDLCRDSRGVPSARMDSLGAFNEEVSFRSTGYLFGHKEIWSLFQRLLRIVKHTCWPEDYLVFYRELDLTDMSRQRHSLHYNLEYWVMDDLCDTVFDDAFANMAPTGAGKMMYQPKASNFSIAIGLTATQMAMQLFEGICELTNRLQAERELFQKVLNLDRHPYFAERIGLNAA